MQNDQTKTPDLADAARREIDDARERLSGAAEKVRDEAMQAGTTLSTLVMDELDRRTADLGDGMHIIAERLRSSVETSGDGAETPAIVTQAVDMIDDLSVRVKASSARDLGDRLSRYGRENPLTFMAACLASGVLAGRFLIATSGDAPSMRGGWDDAGYRTRRRDDRVDPEAPSDLDLQPGEMAAGREEFRVMRDGATGVGQHG